MSAAQTQNPADTRHPAWSVLELWRRERRRVLVRGARPARVHGWRIATRRLLAAEAIWGPVLRRGSRSRLEGWLRPAFKAAGRVREAQIIIDEAEVLAERFPAARRLERRVRRRLPRRQRRFVKELERIEGRRVRRYVASWEHEGRAKVRCARAWTTASRALAALADRSSVTQLHRVRVLLKAARYAQELVGRPARRAPSAPRLRQLVAWQRELGAIADDALVLEVLDRLVRQESEHARELIALRGFVAARQERRIRRFLAARKASA